MADTWTFDSAVAFWRAHYEADPEVVWDRFAAAEAAILDHKPTSSVEAEVIFDVVLEQCLDGRSDGRDRAALRRLRDYIRSLHRTIAAAA